MDVFKAVDTRIACRASGGNLQSWNVYALANKPLEDFKGDRCRAHRA